MAGLNCIECGATVIGEGKPQARGFCSSECLENWDEWRLRECGSEVPGLGLLFRDGGWPSFEQAVHYAMNALGCAVEIFPTTEEGQAVELWFSWSVPGHEVFALCAAEGHERLRSAFAEIDGFELADRDRGEFDTDENIGFRVGALRRSGQSLAMMCVDLILEVRARRQRFTDQCERWAKAHVEDLQLVAVSLVSASGNGGGTDPAAMEQMDGFLDWLRGIQEAGGLKAAESA